MKNASYPMVNLVSTKEQVSLFNLEGAIERLDLQKVEKESADLMPCETGV